jgi:ribonuclease BN (tRNA processing enzyme)
VTDQCHQPVSLHRARPPCTMSRPPRRAPVVRSLRGRQSRATRRASLAICFQSFRSSSAGNCLALWTATSSILIDCGVKVQRECREILEQHARRAGTLDAVIVSHAHGDHMAYGSLRVLGREGIRIVADGRVIRQLRDRYAPQEWKRPPEMRQATTVPFDIGDFRLTPIEVPHAPDVPNFAFVITARDRGARRTIVICTDFHDYAGILPRFVDADFIFVEANHDLDLLRQHPNYASRYHLNNVKAASLLHHAARQSARSPKAVMLGHLSEERNRRALAISEVGRMFERRGTKMRFDLDAAPARRASEVVEI